MPRLRCTADFRRLHQNTEAVVYERVGTIPNNFACPRCGYDVSGMVPTWTEQCPLEGTCSECGLGFAWVDIFRPERIAPRWSFEHSEKRRGRALVRTALKALRPGRMWRQMSLAAPVRIGRLAVLFVFVVLLTHLYAVGIMTKLREPLLWGKWQISAAGMLVPRQGFAWSEFGSIAAWPYQQEWIRLLGPLGVLIVVWGLLAPLPFMLLPQTMATSKVRRVHLLRGWTCFLPVAGLMVAVDIAMMSAPQIVLNGMWGRYFDVAWTALGVLLFLGACVLLVRWWWMFTRYYLQLPRARAVATAMLAISLLVAVAVCLTVDQGLRYAFGGVLNAVLGWNAY